MNDVFAERLKNARIMKGYSMDDLVKELGNCVTKTAIMKYEKGIMKPNSSLIISLSNVLNQPVDYFFRPFSFCIDSISFRKKSSLSIKEENAIKENDNDLIAAYIKDAYVDIFENTQFLTGDELDVATATVDASSDNGDKGIDLELRKLNNFMTSHNISYEDVGYESDVEDDDFTEDDLLFEDTDTSEDDYEPDDLDNIEIVSDTDDETVKPEDPTSKDDKDETLDVELDDSFEPDDIHDLDLK